MTTTQKPVVRGVRAFSSLLELYESGYAPDDVKRIVIDTLLPEFEHPDILERYTLDLLTVEAVNVQKIRAQQRDQSASPDEVNELTLGAVTQRIGKLIGMANPLEVRGVPLNQWRNIAQHFSMKADGSAIECFYGRGANRRSLALERPALLDLANALFLLCSAVRTSHTIFFLDNADALARHCKGFHRGESDLLFQFTVGAASQGFQVVASKLTAICLWRSLPMSRI